MLDEQTIHPAEAAVRENAVKTLRALLPLVAPNIAGYEMRALPGLVAKGAERLRADRDNLKRICDERWKYVEETQNEVYGLRGALETLHDELFNFAHYSRGVAAEAVGDRRDLWLERAEWADRLAALASPRHEAS
jgi:hypothetical protein